MCYINFIDRGNGSTRGERKMTSYIPKYQFEGIMAKRKGTQSTIKYRQKLKSGKWGAVHEYKLLGSYETPEQAFERLVKLNSDREFMLEEC